MQLNQRFVFPHLKLCHAVCLLLSGLALLLGANHAFVRHSQTQTQEVVPKESLAYPSLLTPSDSFPRQERTIVANSLSGAIIGAELDNSLLAARSKASGVERDTIEGSPLTTSGDQSAASSSCQLVPIVHLLKHPGCLLKAISSFACSGACPSYVQTSSSKFWQHERSCSCCQQTGSQEATFTLDCPSLDPPYKKIKTQAPVDCLCRACANLEREQLRPQELLEALAGDAIKQDKPQD